MRKLKEHKLSNCPVSAERRSAPFAHCLIHFRERNTVMHNRILSIAAWSLVAAMAPIAAAQDRHGNEQEHGEPQAFKMPTTYKAALGEIEHRLHEISELMESGKLDKVHAEAAVIRDVAKNLAKLALKKDSGVPREAIRGINLTAKDLAAKFGPIDEAGDSGNLYETKKVYDAMVKLAEKLPKTAPATYAEAISALRHHLHEISELIESKKLDHVHTEAAEVRDIAKTLAGLAKKDSSGVQSAAIKEIKGAAKDLAAQYGPMDEAGDSGNLTATKKIYHEMVELVETLEKHVPQMFACPMGCEGDKTYAASGKCPKCGMNLKVAAAHKEHDEP